MAFLCIEILFIKQCPLKFTSSNRQCLTKIGAKRLSDFYYFITSFLILLLILPKLFPIFHLIHFQQVHISFIRSNFLYLNFKVYHQNLSFFTKSAISGLLAKFACFNLAAYFSDVNLLNS